MQTVNIADHLKMLGHKVEDLVTGFTGHVSSIGFDLYGCVQAVVTPAQAKDGKTPDSQWFDTKRLKVLSKHPVIAPPLFTMPTADVPGGFDKPIPRGGY